MGRQDQGAIRSATDGNEVSQELISMMRVVRVVIVVGVKRECKPYACRKSDRKGGRARGRRGLRMLRRWRKQAAYEGHCAAGYDSGGTDSWNTRPSGSMGPGTTMQGRRKFGLKSTSCFSVLPCDCLLLLWDNGWQVAVSGVRRPYAPCCRVASESQAETVWWYEYDMQDHKNGAARHTGVAEGITARRATDRRRNELKARLLNAAVK